MLTTEQIWQLKKETGEDFDDIKELDDILIQANYPTIKSLIVQAKKGEGMKQLISKTKEVNLLASRMFK